MMTIREGAPFSSPKAEKPLLEACQDLLAFVFKFDLLSYEARRELKIDQKALKKDHSPEWEKMEELASFLKEEIDHELLKHPLEKERYRLNLLKRQVRAFKTRLQGGEPIANSTSAWQPKQVTKAELERRIHQLAQDALDLKERAGDAFYKECLELFAKLP
ncbi:MAG: hypothetical protein K0S07_572 [Chlamydiales bacterium]|nr:hypothetical protein [Chlamydiales bacterium]